MAELLKSFGKLDLDKDKKSIIDQIKGIVDGDCILCLYPRFRETFFFKFEMSLDHITDGVDERKITVELCKAYLRENGLRLTGTKSVLLERIKEHIQWVYCYFCLIFLLGSLLNISGNECIMRIQDNNGLLKYLEATFTINCQGMNLAHLVERKKGPMDISKITSACCNSS